MSYLGTILVDIGSIQINFVKLVGSVVLATFSYWILKKVYALYRLLTGVHEYRPTATHLTQHSVNKLHGKVKRKNGEMVPPEVPPVPNGWFYVMTSYDLEKEQVKYVKMCGLELAVFRDENGEVHALDAFCPHLGANMGIGGKVKGDCLECPFHAWRFNGADGKCTHIPGAKRVPEVAKTKSWPVLERNQIIMLWFDAEDREPMYLPRECEQIYQDGWVIHARGEHIVNCHISEIPENGADLAHFSPVHKSLITHGSDLQSINETVKGELAQHTWSDASWKVSKEEWYKATGTLRHGMTFMGRNIPPAVFKTRFEQIGPSIVYLMPTMVDEILLIQCTIPVETFKTRMIHIAFGPKSLFGKLQALFLFRGEACMVERDIMIWNNKLFSRPSTFAATPADELLVKFRRWYSQFYSENSKPITQGIPASLDW